MTSYLKDKTCSVSYVSRTSIRWDVMTLPKCVRRRWTILLNWRNQGKNVSHLKWRHTAKKKNMCKCWRLLVSIIICAEIGIRGKSDVSKAFRSGTIKNHASPHLSILCGNVLLVSCCCCCFAHAHAPFIGRWGTQRSQTTLRNTSWRTWGQLSRNHPFSYLWLRFTLPHSPYETQFQLHSCIRSLQYFYPFICTSIPSPPSVRLSTIYILRKYLHQYLFPFIYGAIYPSTHRYMYLWVYSPLHPILSELRY